MEFISKSEFPGWEEWRNILREIDASLTLRTIQILTRYLSNRQGGVFRGVDPIFPFNIHIVVRETLKNLDGRNIEGLLSEHSDQALNNILKLCRQLNFIRETHPSFGSDLLLPKDLNLERKYKSMWFHHLEQQGKSWVTKIELGRSQRMFVELWNALYSNDLVKIRGKETIAFMASSYGLLLSLGVWKHGGTVTDVRTLLENTDINRDQILILLENMTKDLADAKQEIAALEDYPQNTQNYLKRFPLIRLDRWAVFAPLPYLLLQGWDLKNLYDNLECTLANVGEKGGREFYRAFGVVNEEYVGDLVKELSELSDCNSIEPFKYNKASESPDDLLLSPDGNSLVFEAKCYRIPQHVYKNTDFNKFLDWFACLLGTDDKDRAPLVQGYNFYNAWEQGNPEITSRLGDKFNRSMYIVVSHEDIPFFVNWNEFREYYRINFLSANLTQLWNRTVVISVRCLEKFVALGQSFKARGEKFNPIAIMNEYDRYRREFIDISLHQVKATFGEWIVNNFPHMRDHMPDILFQSLQRLFNSASRAGFDSRMF